MVDIASEPIDISLADPGFADLLDELSRRIQSGEGLNLSGYLTRYPQYRDQLEKLVPAMQTLAGIGEGSAEERPTVETAATLGAAGGRLGDFRILRELGRGGMGIVYEAEQISLHRRVALKMLPFAGILDEQSLKRFQNEALAAASLTHPNIVSVYFVGCDRGVHYYAMQLIEGQSLAELIDDLRKLRNRSPSDMNMSFDDANRVSSVLTERFTPGKPSQGLTDFGEGVFPPAKPPSASETRKVLHAGISTVPAERRAYFRMAAKFGMQAAEALDHAHANGILHRDVKPGNLLIDPKGKVFLTDFGLARIEANAAMTMTGDVLGTLRYMCPEAAAGGSERLIVDQRGDIYSLGATLYELFTLVPAFEGKDRKELFQRIIFGEPSPPRRVNRAIPASLETIVLKAMRKDPASRYATAGALADDLRRFLFDEPIRAKRPTLAERMRMWSRRNRAIATSIAVITALLVLGSVLTSGLVWREQKRTAIALRESNSIIDFLINDLLASAAPIAIRETPVTVEEVLANAEKKVEAAFKDEPLVEAAIRHTIGKTYTSLGRFDLAERHLTRARELRSRFLGEKQLDTQKTITGLGVLFSRLGRYQDAYALYKQVVDVQRRTIGFYHPETQRSMGNLAASLSELGRYREAQQMLEELLEVARTTHDKRDDLKCMNNLAIALRGQGKFDVAGELLRQVVDALHEEPEDELRLLALDNLGNILRRQRKFDEAVELHEKTVDLNRRKLGPEHPATLTSMDHLAMALNDLDKTDEARTLQEKTLEIRRRTLGREHPSSLSSMFHLAILLEKQHKFAEARALDEQVLECRRRVLGPEHPHTLAAMNNLANVLTELNRNDEAIALQRQVLGFREQSLGSESLHTLASVRGLASALLHQGSLKEALGLYERESESRRRISGPEDLLTLEAMSGKARVLERLGEYAEANAQLDQVLETQRRTLGPEHAKTLVTMNLLGVVLGRQSKWDQAFSVLEPALKTCQRVLGPDDALTLETMQNLAIVLSEQGKSDDALALQNQALDGCRRVLGSEHRTTLAMTIESARLHASLGQMEEAHAQARQAVETCRRVLPADHPLTLEAGNVLARALEGQKHWQEARELRASILASSHQNDALDPHFVAELLRGMALNIALTPGATATELQLALEPARDAIQQAGTASSYRVLGVVHAALGAWKESLVACEKAVDLGYRGELIPAAVLSRIDPPTSKGDQDFQRLMKLQGRDAR